MKNTKGKMVMEELERACKEKGTEITKFYANSESLIYDEDYNHLYIGDNAKDKYIRSMIEFLLTK